MCPVKSGYRIAEVAERTGVTPATLRYYEQVGVLPAPERAENGYRIYGEAMVDRLAFIARAKQLGCTLEEIADLSVAWSGGECGPLQDRLRRLVAEKLAAAETEIVELMTLTAELRTAAAALERHRPVGPCDDSCGCVNSDSSEAETFAIALTAAPQHDEDVPIACTLSAGGMKDRVAEWQRLLGDEGDLLGSGVARSAIPGGIRLDFGANADINQITRLAVAEQDCCRFFSFAITVDRRGIGLEVTAPDDASATVHALFGVAS
jgi:MerR family transcriptional regulator, copper efflux regulator